MIALQLQKVIHVGAVRVFDEDDSSGYRVAVIIQTEVEAFEHVREIVHGQLQIDL